MITTLKLRLTSAQLRRLLFIVDESFCGNVTLDEYQNALEAFQLNKDCHIPGQGQNGQY